MKVVGLVTEYNPFHNGHLHHLNASKQTTNATHSIAVMSGHFLQRGEPALLDKWTRAKNAVSAGVDLVIELPTLFSCSSAEYFSFGAVSLLKDLNIVDALCFGSEDGNISQIQTIANLLAADDSTLLNHLENELAKGISFPKARANAIEETLGETVDFKPNNILGIEYLKAINVLNSPFEPFTIQRVQADYMSTTLEGSIASATGIRVELNDTRQPTTIKAFVPPSTFESIKSFKEDLIYPQALGDLLLYKIRTTSETDLRNIHDVTEGLESRIKKVAERVDSYEALVKGIETKRYTRTRIQRVLIKILLNIYKETLGTCGDTKPLYARILAFNEKGQQLIKRIKKESDITLITNVNKTRLSPKEQTMLNFDINATNVYNLLYQETHKKTGGSDYLINPIQIKE